MGIDLSVLFLAALLPGPAGGAPPRLDHGDGADVEYYFGYELPENDLVCEDFRSRYRSWDYCRVALSFFKDHATPFWEMSNANPSWETPRTRTRDLPGQAGRGLPRPKVESLVFTNRTLWDRRPNPLARAAAERRRDGRAVLDLTESNPTRCGFDYPDEAIRAALGAPGALSYDPHPRGLPEARRAVAEEYAARGVRVDPEHLLLTSGTSEAYAFLFRLLVGPGESVLVPRPGYPLLDFLARSCDAALRPYALRYDGRWGIDLDSLRRAAAAPGARALVVVHPNNPTGSFVTREEQTALTALCRERGMAVIADEVFSDYAFDDARASDRVPSFACEADVLSFALGGLSKSAGLPGLKLSWIAVSGPGEARDEALARLELLADTYLSVGTPVQRALPRILDLARPVREQIQARVRANRRTLAGAFGPSLLAAEGGWYGVLSPRGARSDETLALELLEGRGVLVHPGYFYDFEEEGHLVVSLLLPPDVFEGGVRRLAEEVHG